MLRTSYGACCTVVGLWRSMWRNSSSSPICSQNHSSPEPRTSGCSTLKPTNRSTRKPAGRSTFQTYDNISLFFNLSPKEEDEEKAVFSPDAHSKVRPRMFGRAQPEAQPSFVSAGPVQLTFISAGPASFP
ncbi:uncharacterized protein LOC122137883 isoform X2 [Cyprinus carpio]|uniref:Uncharacterized protein LOC122137883 isoform X2 n=1 Tax=Cyprinus carpio TaxID=7962 RepID=A0A9R0A2Q5_CYPCA|nr:uncharacterized protein LOC122137883 isoform X2 [Cyprinus carpio]